MAVISFITRCLLCLLICSSSLAQSESCDSLIRYFDQYSKESMNEELLPLSIGDSSEGGAIKTYKDDAGAIVSIDVIHFAEIGKKEVSYIIVDENNHRIDVSEVRYNEPIKVDKNITIRERNNKRVDICDGIVVDVFTDSGIGDGLTFVPLNKVLQKISDLQ